MDPLYTQAYEQFELRHWWFVARREIIHWAIGRWAPANARWLDVGCGTGVLLDSYSALPNKMGLELDGDSVARAKAKGLDVRQVPPVWDFSPYGQFDLITLTDVIEHVEHEAEAINAARAVLKDGGILLVTVPALMSLWSGHDVINRHYRRYTRQTLLQQFPTQSWDVLKVTYFSSLLLPMVWAARMWKNLRHRGNPDSPGHDFSFTPLDPLLLAIFRLEKPWLRAAGFPLGSSLLLVVRKKQPA